MKLLERLFAPDLASSLKQREFELDFFKRRFDDSEAKNHRLELELSAGKKLYTVTTQHLISEILKLAGGRPVPKTEESEGDKTPAANLDDFEITPEQKNLLRMRAVEACEQKILDRQITESDIDAEYSAMMQNPYYYLSD